MPSSSVASGSAEPAARIILNASISQRVLGASLVSELVQSILPPARPALSFGHYFVAHLMRKLANAGHAFRRASMPASAAIQGHHGGTEFRHPMLPAA
jgi:hypothetical protein